VTKLPTWSTPAIESPAVAPTPAPVDAAPDAPVVESETDPPPAESSEHIAAIESAPDTAADEPQQAAAPEEHAQYMAAVDSAAPPPAAEPVSPVAAIESASPAAAATGNVVHLPAIVRLATRSRAIVPAAITALVVAALALPRHPVPDPPHDASPGVDAEEHSTDRDPAAPHTAAAREFDLSLITSAVHAGAPVQDDDEPLPKPVPKPKKPAAAPAPVPAAAPMVEAHREAESSPKAADAEPTASEPTPAPAAAETPSVAPVTIVGCLEVSVDEERFRLADTEGAGAPQARSWRTAFLKKRSTPIDLVGSSDAGTLRSQVGKRVAATGRLTSRELEISSLRVVSPSCK